MENGNIRLNKFLSLSGRYSRRQADIMIRRGVVMVDGKTAHVGMTVNDDSEVIAENQRVKNNLGTKVFLFHKPKGVTCTEKDIHAESKAVDFFDLPYRVFTIGRLDKDSSGLILLTNDGDLSRQVTRYETGCEKEYIVTLDKKVTDECIQKMSQGIYLSQLNKTTLPCIAEKIGSRRIRVVLTQGLNRQIRRMCEELSFRVTALKRVRVGELRLGSLGAGEWIELDAYDVRRFKAEVGTKVFHV